MKKVVVILSSLLFLLALTSWTVANTEPSAKEKSVVSVKSDMHHVHCTVKSSSGQLLRNATWQIQGNSNINNVNRVTASFDTDVSSGSQIDIACAGYKTYTTPPIVQDEPDLPTGLSPNSSSNVQNVVIVLQEE